MSFPIGSLEHSGIRLIFALLLRDRLTFANALFGNVSVIGGSRAGLRKDGSGTFLFFKLPNGAIDFSVRSGADTPYYLPANITVTIPPPAPPPPALPWPAFPNISLANSTLPLWDPNQPAAYRTQFLQCCLSPAIAYPFEPTATLVRGTALHGDARVAGVAVSDLGGLSLPYVTGADGQFVLVFQKVPSPLNVTLRARRAGAPDVDVNVTVLRGATASVVINL
jgi:hypothetical protein